MSCQDDLIAGFGAPDEFSQLTFGFAYGDPHGSTFLTII
jgi:hypothetical protein